MYPCSQQEFITLYISRRIRTKISTILLSVLLTLLGGENYNETLYFFHQFKGRAELLNMHLQSMWWEGLFCGSVLAMGITQKRRTRTKGKRIRERKCIKAAISQYSSLLCDTVNKHTVSSSDQIK